MERSTRLSRLALWNFARRPRSPQPRSPHAWRRSIPSPNTFAVDLSAAGAEFEGHSLVGATPEVLVSRRGRVVTCRPLAGTTKRSADADQDREAGESLLHSTKNLAEHAFVTSWIREVLQPMCSDLSVPATPELTQYSRGLALGQPDPRHTAKRPPTALDLAIALHPTPALCGTPTDAALKVIRETEEPRRFLRRRRGMCDEAGDGDWVVAIRCAEIGADGRNAWAAAGWWNRRRIGSAGRTRRDRPRNCALC